MICRRPCSAVKKFFGLLVNPILSRLKLFWICRLKLNFIKGNGHARYLLKLYRPPFASVSSWVSLALPIILSFNSWT